jgi:RHS repeat-associated protein
VTRAGSADGASDFEGNGRIASGSASELGSQIAAYTYDGLNRRVRKTVTASGSLDQDTRYYYAGWQCLEERTVTTATPESWAERRWRQYTWGGLYLDELVSYETDGDADGELGESVDRTLYVHQDANYNAVAVVLDQDQDAEDGVVQERYEYDAYGRTRFFDKNEQSLSRSGVGLEFLYTGQRRDPETGIYYFKNRYYSVDLGRFITHDPAGYQDGWNLYGAYFAPGGMDPMGLQSPWDLAPDGLRIDSYDEQTKNAMMEQQAKAVTKVVETVVEAVKSMPPPTNAGVPAPGLPPDLGLAAPTEAEVLNSYHQFKYDKEVLGEPKACALLFPLTRELLNLGYGVTDGTNLYGEPMGAGEWIWNTAMVGLYAAPFVTGMRSPTPRMPPVKPVVRPVPPTAAQILEQAAKGTARAELVAPKTVSSSQCQCQPRIRPNPVTARPRTAPGFKVDPTNNVTAVPRTVDQFLTDAERFLGSGYRQGADGQFYSSDWSRRVRVTPSDLAGHGGGPSHGHFEFNGGRNIHIPLTDK